MCLIVCVLPVSAADSLVDSEAVLTNQRQLFGASQSAYTAVYFFDDETKVITLNDGRYSLKSGTKTVKNPWISPGYYIDFVFSIPESGVISFTDDDNGSYFTGTLVSANDTSLVYHDFDDTEELIVTLFIDDVQKEIITLPEKLSLASYPVNHHVRIRLSSNFVNEEEHVFYETGNTRAQLWLGFKLDASFTADEAPLPPDDPTDPTDPSGGGSGSQDLTEVIESIEVVQGHLEEINGNIVDIKDSVEDIKVQIEDTKQQLEDPTSPIWEAAGEAIGNALEGLFVPSEDDIADVKEGFDDLAKDKLGGAYTAMESVDGFITDVSGKLNNPSAAEGIEFPGIAFPMNGELIVIAEKQMVTLPTSLTAILHPIAGSIITIVVGLGTFGVLKDMVECFLSGFSYAAYLHRDKGGSDE